MITPNGSEDVRAVIAVELRAQDILLGHDPKTYDYYLGEAQQLLESSYLNYKHPAGEA